MNDANDLLNQIESHYGAQLPPSYRKWMLENEGGGRHNGEGFLPVPRITWLPMEEIVSFELWHDTPVPGLIPFAYDWEYSVWCFNTSVRSADGECEVLYCQSRLMLAGSYAPSLHAMLFRRCLEFAAWEVCNGDAEIEKARQNLTLWAQQFDGLLPDHWNDCLSQVSARSPHEYPERSDSTKSACVALIPIGDVRDVLSQNFAERYLADNKGLLRPMPDIEAALSAIEDHYGVSLPLAYRKLALNHCLTQTGDTSAYFELLEARWIQPDEIVGYDMMGYDPMPGLIPFATTGHGDMWAWNTQIVTGENEYEILFCDHEQGTADPYAPNFAAWFYRSCLDYNGLYENDPGQISRARRNLRFWADRLKEFHSGSWPEHLRTLANKTPFEYTHPKMPRLGTLFGLITETEIDKIIETQLGPRYLERGTIDWGIFRDEMN